MRDSNKGKVRMASFLDKGLSKLAVDVGTGMVTTLFLDEVWLRLRSFNSHRLYLNAILGFGSGASIALLGLLSIAQAASCAILVMPVLYKRMGTAVPSVALGSTLGVEMLLYHGFNDTELTIKAFMIEAALFLIGLLRGDAKIRSTAIGTPLHGRAIAIEARIRAVCTKLHTGVILPPLCCILLTRALFYHSFWFYSGTAFEIKRTSFCTCVSACALMSLLAGQDRSASLHLAENSVDFVYRQLGVDILSFTLVRKSYKAVFGQTPLGRKKNL